MRFTVRRTSVWDSEKRPCAEAERVTLTRTEQTTRARLDQFAHAPWSQTWFTTGHGHRERKRGRGAQLLRDVNDDAWVVEIADLPALMAFVAAHGALVVEHAEYNDIDGHIEIYDGYRE